MSKDAEMSDEYKEAMRKLGEGKDAKDGWRPLKVDGEIIAWIQTPLLPEHLLKETFAHLACRIGNKVGKS